MTSHITSHTICQWLVTKHLIPSSDTDSRACMLNVLHTFLPVIKPCGILQKWIIEKWNWPTNEGVARKQKIKPNMKRESGCNGKEENVTEEMTCSKTLTLKEPRKISQYWKCKGTDPYLERSMIICQGIEMMLVSYHMLLICWETVVIFKDLEEAPNVYPCLPLQSRRLSRAY